MDPQSVLVYSEERQTTKCDSDGDENLCYNVESEFLLAIKNNDVVTMRHLLESKVVDVDHQFAPNNRPASLTAVQCGHSDALECLISFGCSVNQRNQIGDTPLHQAVRERRSDLIRMLLKERAVIAANDRGVNAVHIAVQSRSLEILKLLLERQNAATVGPILSQQESHGCTPLLLACVRGYDEIVVYLLSFQLREADRWAMFQGETSDGDSMFHFVSRLRSDTVYRLIVELPTRGRWMINAPNIANAMPLHVLAQSETDSASNIVSICDLLLRDGAAQPDVRDYSGRTPLHLAVICGNDVLTESLLRAGCRINIRDQLGMTPLYYAVHRFDQSGTFGAVEHLLAFGVDLHAERWLDSDDGQNQRQQSQWLCFELRQIRKDWSQLTLKRLCRLAFRRWWMAQADELASNLDCLPPMLKSFLLVHNEPKRLHLESFL